MSLADELLADLEEIGNDFDDDEIKVKEEPIDDDDENGHDAIEQMEIDDSVRRKNWPSVFFSNSLKYFFFENLLIWFVSIRYLQFDHFVSFMIPVA